MIPRRTSGGPAQWLGRRSRLRRNKNLMGRSLPPGALTPHVSSTAEFRCHTLGFLPRSTYRSVSATTAHISLRSHLSDAWLPSSSGAPLHLQQQVDVNRPAWPWCRVHNRRHRLSPAGTMPRPFLVHQPQQILHRSGLPSAGVAAAPGIQTLMPRRIRDVSTSSMRPNQLCHSFWINGCLLVTAPRQGRWQINGRLIDGGQMISSLLPPPRVVR